MSGVQTRSVSGEDDDIRVDRWFRRHFPDLKHGRLEKLLRTGQVRVDGGRVKASTRLAEGQEVRIPPLPETPPPRPVRQVGTVSDEDREWIRSLILHEDDDLIALNKPPGIAVQGGRKIARHIDGLLGGLVEDGAARPKLVHRLDRDTSGVLLIAKRANIAAALGETFHGRTAKKTYWALLAGVPKPRRGIINAPVSKQADEAGRETMAVNTETGKKAITNYEIVENAGRKTAWVALYPETGRTHQLRVHCAAIGTPIVGDRKYGGEDAHVDGIPGGNRLHLHARAISFPHPSGGTLNVMAPLPPTMAKTWEFLGFDEKSGDRE